jgi:hypothetical protein
MWDSIDDAMASRKGTRPVVSLLASPDAGHVTGRSIVVDGGMCST